MTNKIVDKNYKFNIYSSFTLSNDDLATMSLLYAPLIGSDAFLLYMSFTSLLERNNLKSEVLTHGDFYDIYSFKPQDFIKARVKLEGIGLLVTHVNSDNDYIYVVLPPVSAKNFIKDATLGLYLYSKVGEKTFDYLYNHFKIERIDKEGYKNVTLAFDEVYESSLGDTETLKKFDFILGKNLNQALTIKSPDFDFETFLKQIDKNFLERGVTSEFQKQIIDISHVYSFDESAMAMLYIDSINKKGYFDYSLLKKKANIRFTYLRNLKAPKLSLKEEGMHEYSELVDYLNNTPAEKILADNNPNFESKDLNTVSSLYEGIDLPRGVINCMIVKVMKDKGGELPSLAYFKKVADSWVSDNVLSTEDAIKYVTTLRTKEDKTKESKYNQGGYNVSDGWEELQ